MISIIELLIRYFYFNLNLSSIIPKFNSRSIYKVNISDIRSIFNQHNVPAGSSLIIHSSLSKFEGSAHELIQFLIKYIGDEGNLLMPTHPRLDIHDNFMEYDIFDSPSTVGFLTEYFRKMDGVKRSQHPFSTIAAFGKNQEWFLKNNLNDLKPLPHGKFSPYYKLAQVGGIAVFIGVTAIGRGTIRHTAEEVVDEKLPLKDWFKEYEVSIKERGKELGKFIVRKSDIKKTQLYISKRNIEKEWLREGILTKYSVNGVPIEFVDCKKCVQYMIDQIHEGHTSYPFAPMKHFK